MASVYIITNDVNNKVYIGQTKNGIEARWKEHVYNATHNQRNQLLYCAMRKYGIEHFKIRELANVDSQFLDDLERHFIKVYNSISPNGYNLTSGGSKFKNDNPMYHQDVRKKVSSYFIGDKNPAKRPEVKAKIRQKAIGRKITDATRIKMSKNNGKYWEGKHLSDEIKAKISKNHGCRGKFGGLNPNSKRVQRLDKETLEVLDEYPSMVEAGEWVKRNINKNASWTNISKVCHGHQKSAFGYFWQLA